MSKDNLLIFYRIPRHPQRMPSAADNRMIRIGLTFFFRQSRAHKKIPMEAINGIPNTVPFGKNTFSPTEMIAAPIRPTTAGFRPDIIPFTIGLV